MEKRGRPKVSDEFRKKPNDKLYCHACEKYFNRSGKSQHIRSKLHLKFVEIKERESKKEIK